MAELCFAVLIKRHGPMVFRTCQAILHDGHDAEDAFQAKFVREMIKATGTNAPDALAVVLDRLEAEDRLERARAKVAASGAAPADTASSQLDQFLNDDPSAPILGLPGATPHSPERDSPKIAK